MERYEKSRRLAQLKVDQDNGVVATKTVADDSTTPSGSDQEASVPSQPLPARRTTRKKSSSISQSSGSLKGLRNKVGDSLHGKARNVLGVESSH